eukprot:2642065-Rhodomonas_salina.1
MARGSRPGMEPVAKSPSEPPLNSSSSMLLRVSAFGWKRRSAICTRKPPHTMANHPPHQHRAAACSLSRDAASWTRHRHPPSSFELRAPSTEPASFIEPPTLKLSSSPPQALLKKQNPRDLLEKKEEKNFKSPQPLLKTCLLYTSPSPRDRG